MNFLIDNALSPVMASYLTENGHFAKHVKDYGMRAAADEAIFKFAEKEDFIVISADTDFGTILALRKKKKPSVVLFRRNTDRHLIAQSKLLLKNLDKIKTVLDQGSIVVFDNGVGYS